jgi:hypothetical protein
MFYFTLTNTEEKKKKKEEKKNVSEKIIFI